MNTINSDSRALNELFTQRSTLGARETAKSDRIAEMLKEPSGDFAQAAKTLESSAIDSSKIDAAKTNNDSKNADSIKQKEQADLLNVFATLSPLKQNQEAHKADEVSKIDGVGESGEFSYKNPYESLEKIQDSFTPSKELVAAMKAKSYVKNGLADVDSFKSMAKQLQADGVLNRDDMMAVDFLSAKAPNISLQDFDAMIKNDNLSREMRGLIAQLVQKLHMVNYISGGLMNA